MALVIHGVGATIEVHPESLRWKRTGLVGPKDMALPLDDLRELTLRRTSWRSVRSTFVSLIVLAALGFAEDSTASGLLGLCAAGGALGALAMFVWPKHFLVIATADRRLELELLKHSLEDADGLVMTLGRTTAGLPSATQVK